MFTVLVSSTQADDSYITTAFSDGTVTAEGQLVDLYTGVTGVSQTLGDVTDTSMSADLVEVDGGLYVCGNTIQTLHQKWCVDVESYVARK
jgi:hypothetical protein